MKTLIPFLFILSFSTLALRATEDLRFQDEQLEEIEVFANCQKKVQTLNPSLKELYSFYSKFYDRVEKYEEKLLADNKISYDKIVTLKVKKLALQKKLMHLQSLKKYVAPSKSPQDKYGARRPAYDVNEGGDDDRIAGNRYRKVSPQDKYGARRPAYDVDEGGDDDRRAPASEGGLILASNTGYVDPLTLGIPLHEQEQIKLLFR